MCHKQSKNLDHKIKPVFLCTNVHNNTKKATYKSPGGSSTEGRPFHHVVLRQVLGLLPPDAVVVDGVRVRLHRAEVPAGRLLLLEEDGVRQEEAEPILHLVPLCGHTQGGTSGRWGVGHTTP